MIEILRLRLRNGVEEADFLAADRRLQSEFAYHQPGLLRRTTARSDSGEWVVVEVWHSVEAAAASDARWDEAPATAEFMALAEPSSVQRDRYLERDWLVPLKGA